jgi:hypothetical protein
VTDHETTALPAERRSPSRTIAWACAFAAWMTATGAALAALTDYASQPGIAARAPTSWPAASRLPRTPGRGTLVMLAHTKCSCSRASLHELARVMGGAGDRIEAIVVFVGPDEGPGLGGVLDLRATARAIPNVRVVEDESEARLFSAATSGQALLYDAAGALVFRGGLTAARGHEGDSAGGVFVRRFAIGEPADRSLSSARTTAVYGCALFDDPRKQP